MSQAICLLRKAAVSSIYVTASTSMKPVHEIEGLQKRTRSVFRLKLLKLLSRMILLRKMGGRDTNLNS